MTVLQLFMELCLCLNIEERKTYFYSLCGGPLEPGQHWQLLSKKSCVLIP